MSNIHFIPPLNPQAFTEEVLSHCESIDVLSSEATDLRPHGGSGEGRMVDRWVSDVVGRWEDLNGALEERQVCVCGVCVVCACVVCVCVCELLCGSMFVCVQVTWCGVYVCTVASHIYAPLRV